MATFDQVLRREGRQQARRAQSSRGSLQTSSQFAQLLQTELIGAVRRTDNCVRKPVLASWLLGGGTQ
jgi:hypothetical protein